LLCDKLQFAVSGFGDKLKKLVEHQKKKAAEPSREALAAFSLFLGYSRRLDSLISPSRSARLQAFEGRGLFLITQGFEDSLDLFLD